MKWLKDTVAEADRLKDTVTGALREIPCKGAFIAIGHIPNTDCVADLLERDADGYIVPAVGEKMFQEN